MIAKLITLRFIFDAEDEEPLFETLPAYLVGENRALFISERLLWAHEVHSSETDPDIYVGSNEDAGVILAENVTGSIADVVPTLIERWTSMNALEFVVRDLVAAPLLELGLTI